MASAGNITWDLVANSSKFKEGLNEAEQVGKKWSKELQDIGKNASEGISGKSNKGQFVDALKKSYEASKSWAGKIGHLGEVAGEGLSEGVLGAVKNITKELVSPVEQLAGKIPILGAFTAAIGAIGAGFLHMDLETSEAIKKQADFAERIGISTKALSGLEFAAQESGVGVKTMDTALQRMVRRVSDATQGSNRAAGALKDLGLNAKQLNELSPSQEFLKIGEALQNIHNRGNQVKDVFSLFDSEGVGVIDVFDKGTAKIKEMMEESEKLGLSLSSIKTTQVEQSLNSFDKLKDIFEGISKQITVAFAPSIEAISNHLLEMALNTKGFGNIGQTVFNAVANGVGHLADGLHLVNIGVTFLETNISKVTGFFGNLFKVGLKGIQAFTHSNNAGLQSSIKFFSGLQLQTKKYEQNLKKLEKEKMPSKQIKELIKHWQDVSKDEAKATLTAKKYTTDTSKNLNHLFGNMKHQTTEYTNTTRKAVGSLRNEIVQDINHFSNEAKHKSTSTANSMKSTWENWKDQFADILTQGIMTGKFNFADFAKSMIADLVKVILKATVLKTLLGSLGGGGGGIGGFLSGIFGFAKGGFVHAGIPVLVGEKGAEIFTPSSSGTIIPHDKITLNNNDRQTIVNIHTQPGEIAEVNKRLDKKTEVIDIILTNVDEHIATQVELGQGLATILEDRYSLARR